MAHYMFQGSYTSEGWKTLVKNPVNRFEAVRPVIEKLGGSIEGAWFAFGDYDFVLVAKMPDDVSAAAFSLAASAGGAVRVSKTTTLLTAADGLAAMKKAGGSGYQPPGK